MINVYIAPHDMKRYNDGVMYDIAEAIQLNLTLSGNAKAILPTRKRARRIKYDNIREARSVGARMYVTLQETHIDDVEPTMGIYCSKLNEFSQKIAIDLDKALEGILPFKCEHVRTNMTNTDITHFEYDAPVIIFYINYDRDDKEVTQKIASCRHQIATAFAAAIRKHTAFIELEDEKAAANWQNGDKFHLSIPDNGKIPAYTTLTAARARGYNEYFLYSGRYIVYDYKNGCINVSNSASVPGVWIRLDDVE